MQLGDDGACCRVRGRAVTRLCNAGLPGGAWARTRSLALHYAARCVPLTGVSGGQLGRRRGAWVAAAAGGVRAVFFPHRGELMPIRDVAWRLDFCSAGPGGLEHALVDDNWYLDSGLVQCGAGRCVAGVVRGRVGVAHHCMLNMRVAGRVPGSQVRNGWALSPGVLRGVSGTHCDGVGAREWRCGSWTGHASPSFCARCASVLAGTNAVPVDGAAWWLLSWCAEWLVKSMTECLCSGWCVWDEAVGVDGVGASGVTPTSLCRCVSVPWCLSVGSCAVARWWWCGTSDGGVVWMRLVSGRYPAGCHRGVVCREVDVHRCDWVAVCCAPWGAACSLWAWAALSATQRLAGGLECWWCRRWRVCPVKGLRSVGVGQALVRVSVSGVSALESIFALVTDGWIGATSCVGLCGVAPRVVVVCGTLVCVGWWLVRGEHCADWTRGQQVAKGAWLVGWAREQCLAGCWCVERRSGIGQLLTGGAGVASDLIFEGCHARLCGRAMAHASAFPKGMMAWRLSAGAL